MDTSTLMIIAVAIVAILGVVFFVIKSKKKDDSTVEQEVTSQESEKISPKEEKKARIIEEAKQARIEEARNARLQEKKQEQTPAETTLVEEVAQEREEVKISLTSTRAKRDVPAHDKIVKENFEIFAGMKILVAEDNMINQKVIKGLLAASGIELIMADDGQVALDILEKDNDFVIVLMDAHMPNVDGFEAARRIRANANYNNIVVVALSGDTASDDIRKMINAGMQEQLEKPLRMDALYDVLYAYADSIKETQESTIEEEVPAPAAEAIISTSGLDTEKGLMTCGGDRDFYVELLNEFAGSYEESRTKLDLCLNNNDLVGADKLMHEIVGVSGNIGATALHAHVTTIRETIKANDIAKCFTLADKYEDLLMEVLEEIVDYQ